MALRKEKDPTLDGVKPSATQCTRESADAPDPILNGNLPESCETTEAAHETPSQPSTAQPALQQWNHPRINMWRTFAAFLAMFLMGCNDAVYGVSSIHLCPKGKF